MSFRVVVTPEDARDNGYILKPLVERMLAECGRPNARVEVLNTPRARGYNQAKTFLADHVFDSYRQHDLILFLPDADGKDRSEEFRRLEQIAGTKGARLLCCAGIQEIEVWLLAGHIAKLSASWDQVRANLQVKETIFRPFLAQHGNRMAPGEGRAELMKETLQNYNGLLGKCPELNALQERVKQALAGSQ